MDGQFSREHREMIATADAILQVARDTSADASARLTQLRLALSRLVADHCSKEAALIDDNRQPCRSPQQAQLLKKYHDDLLQWRHDLIACNAGWPPSRVFASPAQFGAVFGGIATRLRARILWEEREFYPAVLQRQARAA